jgi:serine protease Do
MRLPVLLLPLSLAMTGCGGAEPPAGRESKLAASTASASVTVSLTPREIAARVMPSVVSLKSSTSLGSGFVVRADGLIATNLHVLAGAPDLEVVLRDGSKHAVKFVIAIDPSRDLALVSIEKKGLPELTLGESEKVQAGDPVVAIGHPLGLEDTVSDGLVSAVRDVEPGLTLLQISAPIAPGSSGGPLIDNRGNVIGIATAVSREGQNLAFGVPSMYLKALIGKPEPVLWTEFIAARSGRDLPLPQRNIPKHPLTLVAGCGEGDLRLLAEMMGKAIDVGAPLYNSGNFEACYHVYEGAALDADRRLGAGCKGPKMALAAGRKKAASLTDPSAQAWAMRDAFDGLGDVIIRKLQP